MICNEYGTTKEHDSIFLVVQPMHLHQHTRAARARKSANMVSANMVSVLPINTNLDGAGVVNVPKRACARM